MRQNKVLIVDDEKEITSFIQEALQRQGDATDVAYDGEAALEKFKKRRPDLVIFDINLPKLDGLTVCKKIKASKEFVPVIIITGKRVSVNDKIQGLKIGADDCLIKPFDIAELMARVKSMFRLKDMYKELNSINRRLAELSVHDSLTSLYNRRYLIERLEVEIKRTIRSRSIVSCIIIDIDGFKPINDNYGHLCGDIVLKQLANFLKNSIRQTDILARYGGDEFLVVTPDTNKKGAAILANKLLIKLNELSFRIAESDIKLTMSIGISVFSGKSFKRKFVGRKSLVKMRNKLVNDADKALYEAKNKGGDRIAFLNNK